MVLPTDGLSTLNGDVLLLVNSEWIQQILGSYFQI